MSSEEDYQRLELAFMAYEMLDDSDKKKVQRKINALRWIAENGNNHALKNPYETY